MPRALLCVTIDCECDKGPKWVCQRPMRFEGVLEGIVRRIHPLFAAHGAKPTYLLSPELLRNEPAVLALEQLARGGSAELGAHLHGEYAEPGAFEPHVTSAFQRDYPPDVERAKLAYLSNLFAKAFGNRPQSFRAGRFGIGRESIPILEDLGYAVESSVTPHVDWSSAGSPGLSFVGAPTQPYHPDPASPSRPGSSHLLEVPLTIRPRRAGRLPIVGRWVPPRWLRPTWGTAEALVDVAREEIATAPKGKTPVLNAMFHNVEIVPGASPYAATETQARGILGRLAALLAFARREDIAVVGLLDVAEQFA